MNRRHALGSITAAGLASTLPVSFAADTSTNPSALHPPVLGPRMNFAQADRVMAELGIDALVLGDGANFQQATGSRPVVTRMGYPPSSLAIVTRRETERLAIVTPAFSYYYTLSDVLKHSDIPAYIFAFPGQAPDKGQSPGASLDLFPDRSEVALDHIERDRLGATHAQVSELGSFASMDKALAKALQDLGLSRGRIAVDHAHVEASLAKAAAEVTTVSAEDALRRIRPVKSETEIQLMRMASAGNVAAAIEAVKTVRAGGGYRDLRAEFFAAAARRGQRGVFMVVDRTSDELYEDTFRDGQAFLIDCVSEYQGYHGDYGRTVFVGEPRKSMRDAASALAIGWDSIREKLRPGMKFSEINALGTKALRSANKRYNVPFAPHSVGMYHTDHVGYGSLPPREDIVLEPGMILSIDCPLIESGVGGSAHLEDLMLITADGSEPIHDIGNQTIMV
ncbi:MAG: M24 family metallopeptidase [Pseudomonadota bacterium]